MSIHYDIFVNAFLQKITEFELLELSPSVQQATIDGYMRRAMSAFKKICEYDLLASANDEQRSIGVDADAEDTEELADIISEGMIVQWLKPCVYKQELLETVLNTRDFTTYSPSELLKAVNSTYKSAQHDFKQMMREYSYNCGNLTELHS